MRLYNISQKTEDGKIREYKLYSQSLTKVLAEVTEGLTLQNIKGHIQKGYHNATYYNNAGNIVELLVVLDGFKLPIKPNKSTGYVKPPGIDAYYAKKRNK